MELQMNFAGMAYLTIAGIMATFIIGKALYEDYMWRKQKKVKKEAEKNV
jgi:hypothetical protein